MLFIRKPAQTSDANSCPAAVMHSMDTASTAARVLHRGGHWSDLHTSMGYFRDHTQSRCSRLLPPATIQTLRRRAQLSKPHPCRLSPATQLLVQKWAAHLNRMSTVSSKEACPRAPASVRLMPLRVMDMKWPLQVMESHSAARCLGPHPVSTVNSECQSEFYCRMCGVIPYAAGLQKQS